MSPPQTRNGGPPAGPAAATHQIHTATKQEIHAQDATAVRVAATFLPPAGRRTLGVLIVRRCAFCAAGHIHRGAGGLRRAGCDRGEYVVVPHVAVNSRRGAA